jgi:hypothetical protein
MAALVLILITLVGIWVAYYVGNRQGRASERAVALSVQRATPKVGSRISLASSIPPKLPDRIRYAVNTTIYNDGDLVARNLEGEWKLTASHGIEELTHAIRADSLPASLPLEFEHEVSGDTSVLWCDPKIIFQVNIDLVYLGLSDEKEHYHATYAYDFRSRQMYQQ